MLRVSFAEHPCRGLPAHGVHVTPMSFCQHTFPLLTECQCLQKLSCTLVGRSFTENTTIPSDTAH